jgi:hypothetical protein
MSNWEMVLEVIGSMCYHIQLGMAIWNELATKLST